MTDPEHSHSRAKAKPEPASFATVFHAAMTGAPMPPVVQEWADAAPAHAYLLAELRSEITKGGTQDVAFRLLDEVLAEVGAR